MTNIKVIKKNGKVQYHIDGEVFNSFEELPKKYQELFKDKNKDEILKAFTEQGKIEFEEEYIVEKNGVKTKDLPEEVEKLIEDKDNNGIWDIFEGKNGSFHQKYIVNGKEYNSYEDLPEEEKKYFDKMDRQLEERKAIHRENSTVVTNKDSEKMYCDNCGSVLPKKTFFGKYKCSNCGKRLK